MGIRLKSVFCASVIIVGMLVSCASCAKPGDNEQDEAGSAVTTAEETALPETWADDTFIPFENSVVQTGDIRLPQMREDATVIESRMELLMLGLELTKTYDAEFFKDHSLVLVQFEGSSGEDVREVTHLVVRDGLIRPVVTIDSQEDLSDNFEYTFLTVEIEKTNKKMDFGKVMVINTFNPSWGGAHRPRYE